MSSTQRTNVSAPNDHLTNIQTDFQPQHETEIEEGFNTSNSKHAVEENSDGGLDLGPAFSQIEQQRADATMDLKLVSDLTEQLESASIANSLHRVKSTDDQLSAQSSFATNVHIKIPLTPDMVVLAPPHDLVAVFGGFRDALMNHIRVSDVNISESRPIMLTTVTASTSLHAVGCTCIPSCRSRRALETG